MRLKKWRFREATRELVSFKFEYKFERETRLIHPMQVVYVSAGIKELVPEQEYDVFRVHLVIAWVGYDAHERGACAMEQIHGERFTGEHQTTGERARIKPPDE